jgi:hypothetical protein
MRYTKPQPAGTVCCVLPAQVSDRMRKQQRELEFAAYNQRQVRRTPSILCPTHQHTQYCDLLASAVLQAASAEPC